AKRQINISGFTLTSKSDIIPMLTHPCRLPHKTFRTRQNRRVKYAAISELIAISAYAAKLAFLPWNGCEVPGSFYSTGVTGVPGKDCQEVYQPAAAAEARAVERLRQQQQAPDLTERATSIPLKRLHGDSPGVRGSTRETLIEELRQRNKTLVDSAWQSLE
ncbi:hypothetical protein Vretimale_4030, partial [Volvox reticuliferus]